MNYSTSMLAQDGSLSAWKIRLFALSIFLIGMPLSGEIPPILDPYAGMVHEKKDPFFIMIAWISLAIFAIYLLFRESKLLVRLGVRSKIVFLLILYSFMTAIWSDEPAASLLESSQIAVSLIIILASVTYYYRHPDHLFGHAGIALGLNLVVNLASIILLPGTKHFDGRWGGVTGSANYLGAIAYCAIWTNTASLYYVRELPGRFLHVALIVIALICLIGSNSTTSIIAAIIAVAGIVFFAFLSSGSMFRYFLHTLLWLVVIVITLLIFNKGLTSSYLYVVEDLFGREANLTGRVDIWEGTISAIVDRPLLGYGFDADTLSLGVFSMFSTGTHFHNGYISLLVKGGVLGLMLLLGMLISSFKDLFDLKRFDSTTFRLIFSFYVSVLVYNATEVSFLAARHPVWLIFLSTLLVMSLRVDNFYMKAAGNSL